MALLFDGMPAQEIAAIKWQGLLMTAPKNERKTENIVRGELRRLGYFKAGTKIVVEEQRSQIEAVKKAMKAASKSGGGGIGAPEFIISSAAVPDFLLIIECKADPNVHISQACKGLFAGQPIEETEEDRGKRVQRHGVDGVLHY